MFYDPNVDLIDLPPYRRRPNQHFVLFLMETPPQAPKIAFTYLSRHFYTLTMSYRKGSDIFSPFGYIQLRDKPLNTHYSAWKSIALSKLKAAVWMVTSCNTTSRRENYVTLLKQYMEVDAYGKCGDLKCKKEEIAYMKEEPCKQMLKKNYKFYLDFENSVCKDFVTEVFNRLDSHLVPVVVKRSFVEPFLPKGSFIAADDFKGSKELADYLNYLNRNWTAYTEYYKWKDFYEVVQFPKGIHMGTCQLCTKLVTDGFSATIRPSKSAVDVKSWFTDQGECVKDFGDFLTKRKNGIHRIMQEGATGSHGTLRQMN
uniref:Fucosyltransferase n=1 Tax=Trichuris muris TaxID=70415 RepID=A0A5S6QHG8_TRIMR